MPLLSPLGECRLRQGRLLGKLEMLSPNLEQQAQAAILEEEIVNTAAEPMRPKHETASFAVSLLPNAVQIRPAIGPLAGNMSYFQHDIRFIKAGMDSAI